MAAQRSAILLTGARQIGKTSLLRRLFPEADYVSFDWPANADAAENNPMEFLFRFQGCVILDEIQYVSTIFRHLKKWFDVLQANKLFSVLEPYFDNQLKRLVKSPKIYLKDQGLLNFLLGIHSKDAMRNSHYYGALYESFVFNEVSRQAELNIFKKLLYFLRDKNNQEVDFIIEKGDTLKLVEVKTTEYPIDH